MRTSSWRGGLFTGLVERTAIVVSTGKVLRLRAPGFEPARGWSVAVDGSCLTVTGQEDEDLLFDLSRETLDRTIAGGYARGDRVNIELPLRASDRLHGHIVSGHVDCTGTITDVKRSGTGSVVRAGFPPGYGDLVVEKGSIAVDGISLTLMSVDGNGFSVSLVPLTLEATNASSWRPGTRVNLEFDIIAKYILNSSSISMRERESGAGTSDGAGSQTRERGSLLREYLERHSQG